VRQDFLHRFELVLVRGGELDDLVLVLELDFGVGVLQVEARADLLEGLVDGVAHLLDLDFADHVK
jgi:hypothetical protein